MNPIEVLKRNSRVILGLLLALGLGLFLANEAQAARTGTQGSTTASFTSPANSSEVSGVVQLNVTATTTAGVTISEWCFTRAGNDLNLNEPSSITVGGQAFIASTYSGCVRSAASDRSSATITYDTKLLSDGNHTFTARAFDSNNQLSNVASLTIRTLNYQPQVSTPTPILSGTPTVGSAFGVNTGTWDSGVTLKYQWYADDSAISGATGSTFTPNEEQLGRQLSVAVTGSRPGFMDATRTSAKSALVVATGPKAGETPGTLISTFYGTYGSGSFRSTGVVEIEYPAQYVCTASYSCNVPIRYRYIRTSGYSWSWDFRLIDSNTNEQLATFFTSNIATWQNASLYVSNLNRNRDLGFAFYNLSSSETGTILRPGTFRFISANTPEVSNLSPVWQPYVVRANPVTTIKAYQKFKLLQYTVPAEISVVSDCFTISAHVATYNLDTGQANDYVSSFGTNFTLRIVNSASAEVARFDIVGTNNDWATKTPNRVLETPVCGITTKLGTSQNFTVNISYNHSSYGITQAGSATSTIRIAGGLKWTKINCYFGTTGIAEGVVIDAYQPQCPEGWKETKAKVVNGKVTIKTINCLKSGTINVRTINDPVPKCPAGFKETKLPVKNGKLASTTITCVKGIVSKKVTGVLPKCPSGYKKR